MKKKEAWNVVSVIFNMRFGTQDIIATYFECEFGLDLRKEQKWFRFEEKLVSKAYLY